MATNGRDPLTDFEPMAMVFPVFAVACIVTALAAVVTLPQTGNLGFVHSALSLTAAAGFFGAVAPAGSRWRKPALIVGLAAAIGGIIFGGYMLTYGQTGTEFPPTWLTTGFCAFWLGSLWMLAALRFS